MDKCENCEIVAKQKERIAHLILLEKEAYKRVEDANEKMISIISAEKADILSEFAERLNERAKRSAIYELDYINVRDVDDLLEEMLKEIK